MKKRGLGTGLWNHAGGHVEPGETPAEAATRELSEEFGLTARGLEYRGLLEEVLHDGQELAVHTFFVSYFFGEPVETEELAPRWFPVGEVPYDEMWPDDRHWLPLVLEGKRFSAQFEFADRGHLKTIRVAEV
jgi:8-oxo-dGTP diphosphatase